ncbi:hypothetical protein ACEPPN_019225 [Leptodophora sp. 'Broadleaf-Isolate-01']
MLNAVSRIDSCVQATREDIGELRAGIPTQRENIICLDRPETLGAHIVRTQDAELRGSKATKQEPELGAMEKALIARNAKASQQDIALSERGAELYVGEDQAKRAEHNIITANRELRTAKENLATKETDTQRLEQQELRLGQIHRGVNKQEQFQRDSQMQPQVTPMQGSETRIPGSSDFR